MTDNVAPAEAVRTKPETKPVKRLYKKIHVIVNPAAGQDEPVLGLFNKTFKEAEVDWDLVITKEAGDARRLAEEALAAGVDAVAVYGGDGTIMEAASGLIGTDVPMAIFPGGTANVFSVDLGIPSDLAAACALISGTESVIRTIDVGQAFDVGPEGEQYFLIRISVGFEAEMIEGADRELKERMGPLAYALSALQALRDPTIARYHLTLDGVQVETEGLTCIVANSGSVGRTGLSLAPTINVSDGLLDVLVVTKANLASLIAVATSIVTGNENIEPLQHWQVKEVTLVSDPPQTVQGDGEVLGQTPVRARIVPQAFKVIVPKPKEEAA
jgi:diacylglycerol kinase (ATP)